ncbi:hypothetical protein D9757_005286 [Collybiopsis confluens]|uniref:Uncharacterized protein n=1 Tax=Collybiopsis confluens TaxID=2823264 RepID=A0A8H5MDV2_9AGAR|nr:hypothetical protein D9757_005286 [Collybiopsis confluens]
MLSSYSPKVEEYVKAGTLTAIEATSDTIGPGAYGAPFGARFPALREQVESRSETIIVIGNKAKILQAPKLYLPDPKNLHMGWETKDRLEYIKKKGMDPKTTLLFNSHYHWRNAYQLVIPPHYLIKSDLYPKEEYGTNSLGLRVVQVPTQDIPKQLGQLEASGLPACEWDTLGVRDWPADVKLSTAEGREKVLRDGWLRSNIW